MTKSGWKIAKTHGNSTLYKSELYRAREMFFTSAFLPLFIVSSLLLPIYYERFLSEIKYDGLIDKLIEFSNGPASLACAYNKTTTRSCRDPETAVTTVRGSPQRVPSTGSGGWRLLLLPPPPPVQLPPPCYRLRRRGCRRRDAAAVADAAAVCRQGDSF